MAKSLWVMMRNTTITPETILNPTTIDTDLRRTPAQTDYTPPLLLCEKRRTARSVRLEVILMRITVPTCSQRFPILPIRQALVALFPTRTVMVTTISGTRVRSRNVRISKTSGSA